jgi:choline kinase
MGLKTDTKYSIILAAGIGSRLYPITKKLPKSLVKVCGREILDYQLSNIVIRKTAKVFIKYTSRSEQT